MRAGGVPSQHTRAIGRAEGPLLRPACLARPRWASGVAQDGEAACAWVRVALHGRVIAPRPVLADERAGAAKDLACACLHAGVHAGVRGSSMLHCLRASKVARSRYDGAQGRMHPPCGAARAAHQPAAQAAAQAALYVQLFLPAQAEDHARTLDCSLAAATVHPARTTQEP